MLALSLIRPIEGLSDDMVIAIEHVRRPARMVSHTPARYAKLQLRFHHVGRPVVLACVREAERRIAGSHFMEYLPIGGLRDFNLESVKLAYGDDADVLRNGQVIGDVM